MSRYVYFIQAEVGGPVKIGVAQNVEKRLSDMQVGSPFRLRVLKAIDTGSGGYFLERELHNRFKHLRDHGEWFKVDDDLARYISSPLHVAETRRDTRYRYDPVVEPPTSVVGLSDLDQTVLDTLNAEQWMRFAEIAPLVPEIKRGVLMHALRRLARLGLSQSRATRVYDPHERQFMEHRRSTSRVSCQSADEALA